MSDGSLSQDEIDALLQGGGGMDFGAPAADSGDSLSPQEIQDFQNILNGMTDSAASNLSGMIGKKVEINNPSVELVTRDQLFSSIQEEIVEIKIDYTDGLQCEHSYIIPTDTAATIAGLMMGQEDVELNEAALSALEEAGNTIAGGTATVLGDKVGATVMTSPGDTHKVLKANLRLPADPFVKVSYPVTINGNPPAEYVETFALQAVKQIVGQSAPQADMGGFQQMGQPQGGFQQMGQPQMGQPQGGFQQMGQPLGVQSVQYPSLVPQGVAGDQGNIGLLMDVYMEMTVELGRTKKLIREILGFGEGTIIELDKLAGEPVDIMVNHKLIAKGEVVVIDENFGVRVTEIVSTIERISDIT